jgi:hypothetical protein
MDRESETKRERLRDEQREKGIPRVAGRKQRKTVRTRRGRKIQTPYCISSSLFNSFYTRSPSSNQLYAVHRVQFG